MKFEQYMRLATLLLEVEEILLTHERPCGKTKPINKRFNRVLKNISEVRSHLEDIMFIEYPKQATIYVFYPKRGRTQANE